MSDEIEFNRELETNRRFYEAHADELKKKYVGQYLGIAFGRVIAADPDYFKVCAEVDRLDPQPLHQAVFHAESDPAMDAILENFSVQFE